MPEYLLILLRSLIAFVFLFIICRMLGKQQISQLTFFDYVVGITIGSIAANLSVNPSVKITSGIMSLLVWGIIPIIFAFMTLKSRSFATLIGGKPTVIIENGQVNEKNLKKSKLSVEQLMLNLREQNAFKLSDVELAVFETNGKMSVMKKSDQQPITPKILGMTLEQEKRPYVLIRDGQVQDKALEQFGYTKEWLYGEVQKQGAIDFKDVYIAQIDSKGNLYVDLKNDQKNEQPSNERKIVAAQLKKIKADLDMYALDTENQEAKNLFKQQAQTIDNMNKQLEPYLK
ncbi:uncharacterized membrane protein YcaP (DUF421 family) [Pullulanibacillus pueri]|uniref:DUF421 domain-containing protein n=1 Tax=Pullulanibacillus pueri TaxID=1437324 RepID=A0A8J3EM28_9BACL|nr:DUF421 domain-containing protein [Pullulanibacillus pueri]MBM7681421.1 uncharacterized membrane protein YcaP (DUF421 family) [Pullulanibacillus pueri]GGH78810.1 hypothetical protein GCM10007096_12800 [Pullulanibacillus pueri]